MPLFALRGVTYLLANFKFSFRVGRADRFRARSFLDVVALCYRARPFVSLECLGFSWASLGEICAAMVVFVIVVRPLGFLDGACSATANQFDVATQG